MTWYVFRGLARYYADEISMLIADPGAYVMANCGGGKFKLNFHHGWDFVATINLRHKETQNEKMCLALRSSQESFY